MHLGIDVREACREKRAGKGQWTYAFVTELLTRDVELTLYTDAQLPASWQKIIDEKRVRVIRPSSCGLWWHLKVASLLRHDRSIDIYVSPVSYLVPFLLGKKKKVVPVVHDLIAFRNEPHDHKATFIERMTVKRTIQCAHRICTVSETTKKDLKKRYPWLPESKIKPIYAASTMAVFSSKGKQKEIILSIGTLCPRKNQEKLIEAYAMLPSSLREQYSLILVGNRGWHDEKIIELAERTPGVKWKKYLPDAECAELYTRAAVFAYPSLYEGFGMPILDAFVAEVPVLTSDVGSMKEVACDAAVLVDPHSAEEIRNGLQSILSDASFAERLRIAGKMQSGKFTWKKTVELFLNAVDPMAYS